MKNLGEVGNRKMVFMGFVRGTFGIWVKNFFSFTRGCFAI